MYGKNRLSGEKKTEKISKKKKKVKKGRANQKEKNEEMKKSTLKKGKKAILRQKRARNEDHPRQIMAS